MLKLLWLAVFLLLVSVVADAQVADKQRLMNDTCAMISQQRNAVSDAAAMAEAQRRIAQERIEQWETYFRAYVGELK